MSDTQKQSARVALRVPCEGSTCPPAGERLHRVLHAVGLGVCSMCGTVHALVLGRMEQHDRDDVLAMIDRGDYG